MSLEINKIHQGDCLELMERMINKNIKIDCIMTSPPYNTGRVTQTQRSIDNHENRYDIHLDNMDEQEYLSWSRRLFDNFDLILKENGVILYNVSYGAENNPNLMWLLISELITSTSFMVADCIVWKKKSALPNNVSHNKLTRITEFVFVVCRKNEYKTFNTNKKVKSESRTGQKYYENVYNFIDAKNNDGSCRLNKATYSSELCEKLFDIYLKENSLVYDPFIGTGTTGVACINKNMNFIGNELSNNQVEYARKRIEEAQSQKTLFEHSESKR